MTNSIVAKRINIFLLMLIIIGQTILAPLASAGVVFAETDEGESDTQSVDTDEEQNNEDKENDSSDSSDAVLEEETLKSEDSKEDSTSNEEPNKDTDEVETNNNDPPNDEEGTQEPDSEKTSDESQLNNEDEHEYVKEITLEDDKHVEDFLFKVKGKDFIEGETKVSNGDPFELKIDFHTISNDLNYGPGTTLKYELPNSFLSNFSNLKVPGTFGGVGTIKIDGGFVIITLNDGVMIGDTVSDITEGYFTIEGDFSEDNDDWDKEIAMPKGEKFTVNFVPKSGSGVTIHKENGKPNKNGEKSDEINWKVTVNTNLANTSDNPVFTDTLSANVTGHKYDTTSVEIREIDVRPNGTTLVGDIAQDITVDNSNFSENDTKFEVELKKGKAYQITYKTIPENPGINENVTYQNSANYDGTSDSGSTSVHFGKAIEKSVTQPGTDLVTKWTIKYNGNEQLIKSGIKMSDSWTTNLPQGSTQEAKQDLVGGANGVTINGLDPGDYEVTYDHDNQKFDIEFKKDFNHPIEINYSTKPVEGLKGSENFTVVNKAEHGQISTSDTKTASYNQTALTLNKINVGGLDYNAKTMKWRITANQAGYDLAAGTTFVDTFTNKNMVLDTSAGFTVTIDGQPATEGDQADYVLTDNGTDGFTVKLNAATNKQVIIEYTTSFDQIKNVDEDRSKNYHNHIALIDSGLPGSPQHTANINSNSQQKANGSKSGSYNYVDKEFTWTIIFNYNSNTLTNAILKDELPEEHEITAVTLEKGSINSGGTFVPDSDQSGVSQPYILGKHEFSHRLGEINQPYRLVYKTKMKDDVLPVDGENNYSVKNKAELLDGDTPNAKWDRTVTVNHSSKVLDQKNGRQVNGTETIAWDFLYNTAQSKLKNVKITDTFGLDNGTPNQLLDESSLKVYKVTYTSNGTITKKGIELTAGTDYNVSFNTEDGATFVLEFEELDYGIYVEYESVFIGIKDSPISNELAVAYNDGENREGSSDVPNLNFTYGAFASTSAGEFVIIKTDEATGEAMAGVEFTLKNRNGRALTSGITDENGVLDFKMPFATGKYYLEEVTPDGYEPLNNFEFTLKADGGPYEGKQVVNVPNTKTADKDNMCPNFTITVKDVDGNPSKNKEIKLVNNKTGEVIEVTTNSDGQIIKDRADLPAGKYTVKKDGKDLGEIEVQYKENCDEAVDVQPDRTKVCTNFTITLKVNGEPREGEKLTIKKDDIEITKVTGENGSFTVPSADLPAGTYDVYKVDKKIGTVDISYKDECEAEVTLSSSENICPRDIITVNKSNGNHDTDVEVTIVDEDGNKVYEGQTNENGQVQTDKPLETGKTYKVLKGDRELGEFTKDLLNCEYEVQPRPSGGGWTPPQTCDNFTISVNQDGEPVEADVELTLKSGTTEIDITTDSKGKVVIDKADLPEGTYEAYDQDGNQVGTITVTYEEDQCHDEINLVTPNVCKNFTVHVKEDGKPVTSGKYTFTSEDGKTTVEGSVDSNGAITFDRDELSEGKYTVVDEKGNTSSITIHYSNDSCEDEVNFTTEPEEPEDNDTDDPKDEDSPKPDGDKPEQSEENNKPGKSESDDQSGGKVAGSGASGDSDKEQGTGTTGGTAGNEQYPGQSVETGAKGEEVTKEQGTQKGHTLPQTATNMFNYLLAGFVLLISGVALWFLARKKKNLV